MANEEMGRIYSLSWDGKMAELVISIPSVAIKNIKEVKAPALGDTPLLKDAGEAFDFGCYPSEFGADMGFEGCLRFGGIEDDQLIYRGSIPQHTMGKCDICNGTGIWDRAFGNEPCIACNGKKERAFIPWKELRKLSASLSLLFRYLSGVKAWKGIGEQDIEQLMEIQLILDKQCADIYGEVAPKLLEWFMELSYPDKGFVFEDARNAMLSAYARMSGRDGYWEHSIQAISRNGLLQLDVPGSASGVYLGHGSFGTEIGHLYSHNMDTPLQQLTCLVGLAAIEDMYKETL